MVRLSVNINKVATIRNARGGNIPDLLVVAADCERFGADGITVHPRPDQRHIRYDDVRSLRSVVKTEFNIEGYPSEDFLDLVISVAPDQVTLVPDPPDVITSNAGWDAIRNMEFLKKVIEILRTKGIRTSLFMETDEEQIRSAADTGTDRIELYTEAYAANYNTDPKAAVMPYRKAAELARSLGLGINAGHDLNLDNLRFFISEVPFLDEVSIGHALISDSLYYGLENTIGMYKRCLD